MERAAAVPALRARPLGAVAGRLALLAAAAVALALVELPWRPSTLCGVRALTGLPCPLCGGTTAAVAVGRLDLPAALAASPLVVLGAGALALAPLSPARLRAALARRRTPVVLSALALGEVWQLFRLA